MHADIIAYIRTIFKVMMVPGSDESIAVIAVAVMVISDLMTPKYAATSAATRFSILACPYTCVGVATRSTGQAESPTLLGPS
jgi:hypothetical protein